MNNLPALYFRVRENGAAVFRVDTENRNRRIELEQIAVVNTNRGDFKVQGDQTLTPEETTEIQDWLTARINELDARDLDDIHRAVDHMNLTTQWVQAKATDAQLDAVTDKLLLAMHDLRTLLVRKKADRITKG